MRCWTIWALAIFASAAPAVTPGKWTHSAEAHFAKGEFESTVVSSLGQIRLGRAIEVLAGSDVAPPVVSAVAVMDKTIYLSSGSSNVIYRIRGEELEPFATPPGTMVATLLATEWGLLSGTGGTGAGIYRIDEEGKHECLWSDDQIKYVWAIAEGPQGSLYAATGPGGQVFAIKATGEADCIYQADKKLAKNILSLIRSPSGLLYAGTDETGLVLEINPQTKSSRILLDADEKEISALLLDGEGGLYVGTSDVAKAKDDGAAAPSNTKAGKAPKTAPAPQVTTQPTSIPAENDPARSEQQDPRQDEPTTPAAQEGQRGSGETLPTRSKPEVIKRPSVTKPTGKGNAVYYIQMDGLVRTIFRRPVTVLSMLRVDDKLLLGTGNGGDIYAVTTDGDEIAKIADIDARQVTALAQGPDGQIVFATANKGSVGLLGAGFARSGTYTCEALDAKQIAQWGSFKSRISSPFGTGATLTTRSGNVAEPDDATWSDWSADSPIGDLFVPIATPAGRFLQYRIKLTSTGEATPTVEHVQVIYQVGNLAPSIAAVTVDPSAKGRAESAQKGSGSQVYRIVKIKATDPNKDKLSYKIEFRRMGAVGWIQIAEDLKAPKYVWDTRTVGDGTYQLRITASDSPANPPDSALEAVRISEPVVVDNTAPVVETFSAEAGKSKALASGRATDSGSRIVSIHYAVDSQDDWVAVLPADGICDTASEKFTFEAEDLEPGPHRIAVKVTDVYGNIGYVAVTVSVGK